MPPLAVVVVGAVSGSAPGPAPCMAVFSYTALVSPPIRHSAADIRCKGERGGDGKMGPGMQTTPLVGWAWSPAGPYEITRQFHVGLTMLWQSAHLEGQCVCVGVCLK